MTPLEGTLWAALALVAYAYAGFPTVIWCASRLIGRRPRPPRSASSPRVSILISALNEEQVIGPRVDNALMSTYPAERLEIVVASDGSTDRTAAIVAEYVVRHPGRVRLLEYANRRGKATALNESMPQVGGEVVVLSDANTFFDREAVGRLVRWFADPKVGAVCGKLRLVDAVSGKNVDGWYWRYETFLKACEGRLGALLGSNGAIYAIRRDEYVPIAADTIIDDFTIPLLIKLRTGKSIVYDESAMADEETAADVSAEFRRRARIGAGGFQSLPRLWRLLMPRYGWTSFAFWSHKVLRWFCPAFLAVALAANLFLIDRLLYQILLGLQLGFYLAALLGALIPGTGRVRRMLRLTTLFTSVNAALAVGFWRWIAGRQRGTWQRTAR